MARKLQDRLALASYKTIHGQENLSFKDVEARLETTVSRKRPSSSLDTSSNSSVSSSDRHIFSNALASSPLTAPLFSDDMHSLTHHNQTHKDMYASELSDENLGSSKRFRFHSMAPPRLANSRSSWKSQYNLPQSSPVYHSNDFRFQDQSFTSEVSTVPDSPPFGQVAENEHDKLPISFRMDASNFASSPPRTPPPTRHRKRQGTAVNGNEEGADLLLYLATSPSPAANAGQRSRAFAPSTPPSNTGLPSSMFGTPGLPGLNTPSQQYTPGQQFNFADFCNITPSPAQGAFSNRTPGLAKTPLAAKEARRRLNFEQLVPPGNSPNLGSVGRNLLGRESGLGMELGGELVSSQ